MSIPFSNTSTKGGLIQIIERKTGFNDGEISGNTTRLAQFTSDINLAYDEIIGLLLKAGGVWQWDDSNQTDYPIITTNIVSGQRDYSFTTDGSSNQILEIYKVFIANSAGVFTEILPVDVESGAGLQGDRFAPSGVLYSNDLSTFTDGQNATGVPYRYDKLGNGLFLDPIPSYNRTSGLKIYVSREALYFSTSDTTKKAGFAGIFHELLALIPSWKYAVDKNKANANGLLAQIVEKKRQLEEYYAKRDRHSRPRFTVSQESNA